MKRISYEDVKIAQAKTGLGFTTGCFYVNDDNCTCPIGQLYVAATGKIEMDYQADNPCKWAMETYNEDYISGFWIGFDGFPFDWEEKYKSYTLYKLGYDDGVELRRLLIEDGVELD